MKVDDLIKVIGEPMRYKILQQLLLRKHCVRSLSKKMGVSESAISQHLKIMKNAGLVYGEKYGYHTHYFPNQDAIDLLANYFEFMRKQSQELNRDISICQCEFKENSNQ